MRLLFSDDVMNLDRGSKDPMVNMANESDRQRTAQSESPAIGRPEESDSDKRLIKAAKQAASRQASPANRPRLSFWDWFIFSPS